MLLHRQGYIKHQKRQAQIRQVSPTTELEEAIEAKCLGQDSGVSFGRPILEGTDSIPDLQGTPTVDNQVITLIQSFKVVTGKSLTVSQAEDIKKPATNNSSLVISWNFSLLT